MINYNGVKCPVCEKPFDKSDDVVVCPICGAPYHRHCYKEKGECVFHELHEKGESWEAPEVEEPKTASPYEIKDQECSRCGVLNSHSSLFCSNCGNALKIEPKTHNNQNLPNNSQNYNFPNKMPTYGMGGFQVNFDPMGGVSPNEYIDENISYAEVSKVVQQNTMYYLPTFKRIQDSKKSKFNSSAFFFSGAWLLYRKQYKAGILVTTLMFLLYLAQTFTALYISWPKMTSILNSLGETISADGMTTEQLALLAANVSGNDMLYMALPSLMLLLMFVTMLIVGFCGNKMYMKHCIKTINKTRNTTVNSEDFNTRILEVGGINSSVIILIFVCYTLITYLPVLFL